VLLTFLACLLALWLNIAVFNSVQKLVMCELLESQVVIPQTLNN
jgi:hypothetical protein